MRETFIVSADKNNGYPSFSDSVDIESVECKNQNMFLTDGVNYPLFKGKNYPESTRIINTDFYTDGVNYPQMKNVKFSLFFGAFADCKSLVMAIIPESVKSIGENAFTNTRLTSVEISPDCIYSSTSFPKNCEVNFYPNEEV